MTLSAVTSDPDGTIASVGWTFGPDSSTATGTTVTHTFPLPYGTYSIVNTVVDKIGRAHV